MPLFKKKEKSQEEVELKRELKKLPRRRRKKAKQLFYAYKRGEVLIPNQDIDNKARILEARANGQILG